MTKIKDLTYELLEGLKYRENRLKNLRYKLTLSLGFSKDVMVLRPNKSNWCIFRAIKVRAQ